MHSQYFIFYKLFNGLLVDSSNNNQSVMICMNEGKERLTYEVRTYSILSNVKTRDVFCFFDNRGNPKGFQGPKTNPTRSCIRVRLTPSLRERLGGQPESNPGGGTHSREPFINWTNADWF